MRRGGENGLDYFLFYFQGEIFALFWGCWGYLVSLLLLLSLCLGVCPCCVIVQTDPLGFCFIPFLLPTPFLGG